MFATLKDILILSLFHISLIHLVFYNENIHHSFDMEDYPFDVQTCDIKIAPGQDQQGYFR